MGINKLSNFVFFSLQWLLRVIVCCRWNYILSCCILPTDALHLVNGGDMTVWLCLMVYNLGISLFGLVRYIYRQSILEFYS